MAEAVVACFLAATSGGEASARGTLHSASEASTTAAMNFLFIAACHSLAP